MSCTCVRVQLCAHRGGGGTTAEGGACDTGGWKPRLLLTGTSNSGRTSACRYTLTDLCRRVQVIHISRKAMVRASNSPSSLLCHDSGESTSESRSRADTYVLATSTNASILRRMYGSNYGATRNIASPGSHEIRCINRNFSLLHSTNRHVKWPCEARRLLVLYILIYFDVTHFDDEVYRKFRSVVDP